MHCTIFAPISVTESHAYVSSRCDAAPHVDRSPVYQAPGFPYSHLTYRHKCLPSCSQLLSQLLMDTEAFSPLALSLPACFSRDVQECIYISEPKIPQRIYLEPVDEVSCRFSKMLGIIHDSFRCHSEWFGGYFKIPILSAEVLIQTYAEQHTANFLAVSFVVSWKHISPCIAPFRFLYSVTTGKLW